MSKSTPEGENLHDGSSTELTECDLRSSEPSHEVTAMSDDGPVELSRIAPEDLTLVTLAATVDVSMLPEPVRNFLADKARHIERDFLDAVDADDTTTAPTFDPDIPPLRESVGANAVVDLTDGTDAERREAHAVAQQHEDRFMEIVSETYEKYGV